MTYKKLIPCIFIYQGKAVKWFDNLDVLSEDVVELAKEKGCDSKIVIGGAAINESFADEIGADGYSKDAADCVKLVDRLLEE